MTIATSRIFLIGPRGSGKTSLGTVLAHALGFSFVDTDDLVRAETGLDVAGIVAAEGWDGFRRRESEALRAAARPRSVAATGGGMVVGPANRAFMKTCGFVVYLRVPLEELYRRLTADLKPGQRPSLTGKDPLEELAGVLAEREPLYREAAHIIVDAGRSLEEIADEVLTEIARQEGGA